MDGQQHLGLLSPEDLWAELSKALLILGVRCVAKTTDGRGKLSFRSTRKGSPSTVVLHFSVDVGSEQVRLEGRLVSQEVGCVPIVAFWSHGAELATRAPLEEELTIMSSNAPADAEVLRALLLRPMRGSWVVKFDGTRSALTSTTLCVTTASDAVITADLV